MILTDISIPLIDGLELAREVRKVENGTGVRTPIIAITDYAMPDDIKLYRENGIDAHLTKPVSLDELKSCLEKWLNK